MANIGGRSIGIVTLLILAGIILFVFPEPMTSGLGITLILIGVVVWILMEFL